MLPILVIAIEGKLNSLFSSLSKLRAPVGIQNKGNGTFYVDLRRKSGALGENGKRYVSGLLQTPKVPLMQIYCIICPFFIEPPTLEWLLMIIV